MKGNVINKVNKKITFYITVSLALISIGVTYGWSFFNKPTDPALKNTLPGVEKFNDTLLKEIRKKRELRGKNYSPRAKHLEPNGRAKNTGGRDQPSLSERSYWLGIVPPIPEPMAGMDIF